MFKNKSKERLKVSVVKVALLLGLLLFACCVVPEGQVSEVNLYEDRNNPTLLKSYYFTEQNNFSYIRLLVSKLFDVTLNSDLYEICFYNNISSSNGTFYTAKISYLPFVSNIDLTSLEQWKDYIGTNLNKNDWKPIDGRVLTADPHKLSCQKLSISERGFLYSSIILMEDGTPKSFYFYKDIKSEPSLGDSRFIVKSHPAIDSVTRIIIFLLLYGLLQTLVSMKKFVIPEKENNTTVIKEGKKEEIVSDATIIAPMNKTFPLELFYIYFSPYTAHAIEIDGTVFPTVEHAYQCERYTDKHIIEEIRKAASPVLAWEISSRYKHLQIPEFKDENYKLEVMKRLMRMKAEQHADVRRALIDSGEKKIVKHIVSYPPGDGFWDDGEDGTGKNHMGRMWMEIREEIRVK